MKQTQTTRREQWREGILEMLKSAKSDEQGKLQKSSEARREEALHIVAKQFGADKLIKEIDDCRKKSERASDELCELGFSYSRDSSLDIEWDAPDKLQSAVEQELSLPQAANEKSLKRFDIAILKVLTVETPAEAREIAESVIT